jgi:hypothetical protein
MTRTAVGHRTGVDGWRFLLANARILACARKLATWLATHCRSRMLLAQGNGVRRRASISASMPVTIASTSTSPFSRVANVASPQIPLGE